MMSKASLVFKHASILVWSSTGQLSILARVSDTVRGPGSTLGSPIAHGDNEDPLWSIAFVNKPAMRSAVTGEKHKQRE